MAKEAPFDRSLASYALSKAKGVGASYADATLDSREEQEYILKQGSMDGAAKSATTGIRIRFIKNNYLYSMSLEKPTKEGVAKLFSKIDRFKKPGLAKLAEYEGKHSARYAVKEKEEPDSREIIREFLQVDKAISKAKFIKFRYGDIGYEQIKRHFENSDGSDIESTIANMGYFYSIVVGANGTTRQRILQDGACGGRELIDKFEIDKKVLEDAKNMKKVLESGIEIHDLIKRVVISSEIVGIGIHESIGHPLEADRVLGREAAQAGTSYLNTKNLDMRIGSDIVNIYDDPTIEGSNGFYLYDDEGVKARRKNLVTNGIQTELLQNRETAAALSTESNAASRSSDIWYEPLVRMSNTILEPDKSNTFEDLLEEAKDGIYIKNFTEWNIDDTRTFSKYQGNEAYLIKNGRLDKPVKNFALESKTLDFWHAVKMVDKSFNLTVGNCGKGEPMQGVPVSMGGPNALLVFR